MRCLCWHALLFFTATVWASQPGDASCYAKQSEGEFWKQCCDYGCGWFSCAAYAEDIGCTLTNKEVSYQCAGEGSVEALSFMNKEAEVDLSAYGASPVSRVVPDTEWCTKSSDCDPFLDSAQRGCCLVAVNYEQHPYKNSYEGMDKTTVVGCTCQQDASWFEYSQPYSGNFGCQTASEADQVNMPLCNCDTDSTFNTFGTCVSENGKSRFFSQCEESNDEYCQQHFPGGCIKCSMDRLTLRLYASGGAGASKWCWDEPSVLSQPHGCAGGRYTQLLKGSRSLSVHVNEYDGCTWQWDGCSTNVCWRYYDSNDEIPGGCDCFSDGCSENSPAQSLGFCAVDTCDWRQKEECNGFGFGPPPTCACVCKEPMTGPGCALADPEWCDADGTVAELRQFPGYNEITGTVYCHCKPGHAGQRCERVGCASDTGCANNGTCLSSAACANSGECWDSVDGVCLCDERHYGDTCEIELRCTRESYCNGNGECYEENQKMLCECDYSFGGDRCELFDEYTCDPTIGASVSTGCQGLAYCMDSQNCQNVEFDPIEQQYVSAEVSVLTCTEHCACSWRTSEHSCEMSTSCVWVEGMCHQQTCRQISLSEQPERVRMRRCQNEPLCEVHGAECVERLYDLNEPDRHVCSITTHGTCKDSRTQQEFVCGSNASSHDNILPHTCFREPDAVVQTNAGWSDFRLIVRGSTRNELANARLSIREMLLYDEDGDLIGPWYGQDGTTVNNWTVYCNTEQDAEMTASECWRMFDRDYLASKQLQMNRFDPPPNHTAPGDRYSSNSIKECLDHWSQNTLDACYDTSTCLGAVPCVPVMRDGSEYAFEGTPFYYGPCSLSALANVVADGGSGVSFTACKPGGIDYTPAYYYGCADTYWGYPWEWRLDKQQKQNFTMQQCARGAYVTPKAPHNDEQFSDGPLIVTFRRSDHVKIVPHAFRVLCDTENINTPASRNCPNRIELQARVGPGTPWATLYDSKSTRMLPSHRAHGLGRLLDQSDFVFTVPSTSTPFDITDNGFHVSLDVSDAQLIHVAGRTYRFDTVQALHYTDRDVLVPSTERWARRVWRGCVQRNVIMERRLSKTTCLSELAFENKCESPPCCRDNLCCMDFTVPPSQCHEWESWCRDRHPHQERLDQLQGINATAIGNTHGACTESTFLARTACTPNPECECLLGWRKPTPTKDNPRPEDCSVCDIEGEECVHGECGISTNGVCVCHNGWTGQMCDRCELNIACAQGKVCAASTGECIVEEDVVETYGWWYFFIVLLAYCNLYVLAQCCAYQEDVQERVELEAEKKSALQSLPPMVS